MGGPRGSALALQPLAPQISPEEMEMQHRAIPASTSGLGSSRAIPPPLHAFPGSAVVNAGVENIIIGHPH